MKLRTQLKIFLKNSPSDIEKKIAENKLEEVERYLTDKCSARNTANVKRFVEELQRDDGSFSKLKLWKLKQRLCPKVPDPPMAKRDENGTFFTAPELLKSLYLRTTPSGRKVKLTQEYIIAGVEWGGG